MNRTCNLKYKVLSKPQKFHSRSGFPNVVHLALLIKHSRLEMLKIWIQITESLLHELLLQRRIVIYYQIILDIKSWKADPSKTWSQANETKEAYFISNMTSRVMKMIKKLKKPRKCFYFFENCIKTVSEAFKLIRFFISSLKWKEKKDRNNFGPSDNKAIWDL